jgi:hypothetical protein
VRGWRRAAVSLQYGFPANRGCQCRKSVWLRGTGTRRTGRVSGLILGQITKANRYAFDQSFRVKAISLAAQLALFDTGAQLSINFMPGAVYSAAASIQLTLATAREVGFPCDQIIFEITEQEAFDRAHIRGIVKDYRQRGFKLLWMTSVRATPASTCWPTYQPISSSSIWI